jgi:hypothetical protein
MKIDGTRSLALTAALGTTGIEVYCVYDGLKATGGAPLVAGMGIAVVGPLVGAFSQGKRRLWGLATFVLVLACIIVASGSRVGSGIDRAEGQREQASRASTVAKDSVKELHELLEDAKASKKTVCANGKENTKACHDATARVDILLGKWTSAGTTLATAPTAVGEGDVGRVSAWLGGYVTPRQVSLYLPLLWPITMALLSGFFWAAWGDARPPKLAPAGSPAIPKAMPVEERSSPEASADDLAALDVLIDIVKPAEPRKRVEIENIHRAFVEACRKRGVPIAGDEVFSAQAKAFAEAGGIRAFASIGKVYWCGVKLSA